MQKGDAIVKSDFASNWAKAQNYIPAKNTIIVYDYLDGTQRIKLGNGVDFVNDLPFLVAPPRVVQDVLEL